MRLMFWLAGTTLFLGLFAKLTQDIFEHDDLEKIDRAILLFAEKIRVPSFNGVAVDITALGSPTVITFVTVIGLLILWLKKDRGGAAYLAVNAIGTGFWTLIVKHIIGRDRPQIIPRLVEVSGQSYPSGHSLAAAAVYLSFMFIAYRSFKSTGDRIVLFITVSSLIGVIGLSRIYLGVHYPSDVVSGVFLGFAWTFFLTGVFARVAEHSYP